MNDLLTVISYGKDMLQAVDASFDAASSKTGAILPEKVYTNWKKFSQLYNSLSATKSVLRCRDDAWKVLDGLSSHVVNHGRDSLDSFFTEWGGVRLQFSVIRNMAVLSYVTLTWSLYDRVSNVAGRLMGNANIGLSDSGPSDPKLVENFLTAQKGKVIDGFLINEQFTHMYEWPILASYQLRNCLVHDGGFIDGIPFFNAGTVGEAFILNDSAASKLNDAIEKRRVHKGAGGCFASQGACCEFNKSDLRVQLKKINDEIEIGLAMLLKWGINAFVSQVRLFAERDVSMTNSNQETVALA